MFWTYVWLCWNSHFLPCMSDLFVIVPNPWVCPLSLAGAGCQDNPPALRISSKLKSLLFGSFPHLCSPLLGPALSLSFRSWVLEESCISLVATPHLLPVHCSLTEQCHSIPQDAVVFILLSICCQDRTLFSWLSFACNHRRAGSRDVVTLDIPLCHPGQWLRSVLGPCPSQLPQIASGGSRVSPLVWPFPSLPHKLH